MNCKKFIIALFSLLLISLSAYAAQSGTVTASVLNVRSGPGTGYSVIGKFYSGEVIQFENSGNGWYKVYYNGVEGYISSNYVSTRGSNLTDRSSVNRPSVVAGYSTATSLNLRSAPSTDGQVIAALPQYSPISIGEGVNGWYKVTYNGVEGYVSADYVAFGQAPANVSNVGAQVVEYAKQFLGKPYVYGANGPNSFDCSGFVKYVMSQFGVSLPRTSHTQANSGYYVSRENLQMGDLVFFQDGPRVSHVGIYISDGMMIHASSGKGCVTYTSINSGYHNRYYHSARRVL